LLLSVLFAFTCWLIYTYKGKEHGSEEGPVAADVKNVTNPQKPQNVGNIIYIRVTITFPRRTALRKYE
jgi:hypothetical protein